MKNDFLSKRKQDEIPESDVRTFAVKIMLNPRELDIIDSSRLSTNLSRAEVFRALIINSAGAIKKAAVVPEVNLQLARDLGRSLGNLATVATGMRAGDYADFQKLKSLVVDLQAKLRGLK